jgi:hypothetical protein
MFVATKMVGQQIFSVRDPRSGVRDGQKKDKKIRIRDEHPGYATLVARNVDKINFSILCSASENKDNGDPMDTSSESIPDFQEYSCRSPPVYEYSGVSTFFPPIFKKKV